MTHAPALTCTVALGHMPSVPVPRFPDVEDGGDGAAQCSVRHADCNLGGARRGARPPLPSLVSGTWDVRGLAGLSPPSWAQAWPVPE